MLSTHDDSISKKEAKDLDKIEHQRQTTIYGISVHESTGRHRCFNRVYTLLDRTLTPEEIEAMKRQAAKKGHIVDGAVYGNQCKVPEGTDAKEWNTYFQFTDLHAPWNRPIPKELFDLILHGKR